jgi:hypothetical protein
VSLDLLGCTAVRFGPFIAQTSAAEIEQTDSQSVWKVWVDDGRQPPGKILEGLYRIEAVDFAQECARIWREMGKPTIDEVGVSATGPRGPYRIEINHKRGLTP